MAGQGGVTGSQVWNAGTLTKNDSTTSRWMRFDSAVKGTVWVVQNSAAGTPDNGIVMQYSPYRKEYLDRLTAAGTTLTTASHFVAETLAANHVAEIMTKFTSTNLDDVVSSVRFVVTENDEVADCTFTLIFSSFDID